MFFFVFNISFRHNGKIRMCNDIRFYTDQRLDYLFLTGLIKLLAHINDIRFNLEIINVGQ
jgi:hypothetical protein